jgi:hypothetical protein
VNGDWATKFFDELQDLTPFLMSALLQVKKAPFSRKHVDGIQAKPF